MYTTCDNSGEIIKMYRSFNLKYPKYEKIENNKKKFFSM